MTSRTAGGGTRVDLHTHSTASDGLVGPAALMALCAQAGLDVVALTDHDTTAGLAPAAAALPAGLTLVPGAEISCRVDDGGRGISLHLLAYLFDAAEPRFRAARARLRESRVTRAERIVALLAADGHGVTWERVRAVAGGVVGRPHVAQVMVEAGLVGSVAEAFSPRWIGAGGPYFAGKDELDVLDAIRLVAAAGGVSVFAHPYASRRGAVVGADVVAAMAAAGLAGVEVDHPDHDPDQREALRRLAADLGLLVTGSSDFHGASKPQGLGAETTAPEVLSELLARGSGSTPVTGTGPGDAGSQEQHHDDEDGGRS